MRFKKAILPILLVLLCCALLASCALFEKEQELADCTAGHSFAEPEVTKKPTCGVAGTQTVRCTVCGAEEEQEIAPTGQHRLQGWLTSVAATATTPGERVRNCERCGLSVDRQQTLPIGAAAGAVQTGTPVAVDLAEYQLLYDDSVGSGFYGGAVEALHTAIQDVTNTEIPFFKDSVRPTDNGAKEILVGETNRAASAAAKTLIAQDGFAVTVEGNKIAIVGSDALQTVQGVQYFIRTYLAGARDVSVYPRTVASNAPCQKVVSDSGCEYALVFDRNLDNDPGHKYVSSSEGDSRDYPCVAAEGLAASIARLMQANATKPGVRDDSTVTDLELLISRMGRVETEMLHSGLAGDEYAILVKDGKIALGASNDIALGKCIEEFLVLLEIGMRSEGDGYAYYLPEGFYATGKVDMGWAMDFPKPTGTGISLQGTQYVNDASLQFLYTGSGVSADAYRAYRATLLQSGYTVVTENAIEDSLFATLVNTAKGITLSIAYNDYKYKADYAADDAYNVDYQKCIRIISAPTEAVSLPDEGLLNLTPTYEKITDSSITAIPYTNKAVGMGYVIVLEDGRLVVIDGGGVNAGGTEHDLLWETLCALHTQAHGSAPTTGNPVRVAAWILTHSHADHYAAFRSMLKKRAASGLIRMDYLIGNFPDESAIFAVSGSTLYMGQSGSISSLQALLPDGFTYVKVHTGQKFKLANLTLEVLMTFEDHYPRRICNSNDSCTVTRLEIANSTEPNATPLSAVFLADAFRFQSRYLCAMYGTYLKSDVVQVAHHGNIGCEKPVYTAISPTVVLFPHTYSAYTKYTVEANRKKGWQYEVDHYVTHELESVQYIYVSNVNCVTLPLTADGPDYEGIYNTLSGELLDYDTDGLIKKQ